MGSVSRCFGFSGGGGHLHLSANCGFKRLGGSMDFLRVAAGRCRCYRFGGIQHITVMLAQRGGGFFTLYGLALKGVVNRLAEGVPELLLLLALNRHALRFMLPVLLQRLDGINTQLRLGAQHRGFFDHGFAARQAVVAGSGQSGISLVHRGFPDRLDFSKGFFAQMTGFAPFFDKAVQAADMVLPVGVVLVRLAPSQHFVNQFLTLGFMNLCLLLDLFKPGFDHFMGFVAGIVKTLPQRMVGRAALVAGFPLLAHDAQGVLLLAPAQGFGDQRFGLDDQFFANLVGTPALPAFEFAGGCQCGVRGGFQLAVDVADVLLERMTQVSGHLGRGFAVAFGDFMLQFGERFLHDGGGLCAHVIQDRRVHLDFGCARWLAAIGSGLTFGF